MVSVHGGCPASEPPEQAACVHGPGDVVLRERARAWRGRGDVVHRGGPKSAPELGRWLRTVEELHHGLMALQMGWEPPDPDPLNQPTWINPGLHTAIVVSSGEENTGEVTFNNPSNRNTGPTTTKSPAAGRALI